MAEIASAYVTIIPSLRGGGSEISRQLGGVGEAGGRNASSGFMSTFGGVAGRVVGVAAAATGAIGGLVGGLAIKGGIARSLQIEDATAKLTGLGNSTETVKAIMDNALAAVKGTAFGMGEAATVAAGATAAGIKPGKELERVLRLTADAATIAGTDLGSMGSIFNKVAASGKLQGDVIAQLQDAGVPVLQFVAKEMGVTAGEAAKMASSGAISFDIFAAAMESGLGGAALKSGETTRGAFANMKASFSRLGADASSSFMPLMKDVFNQIGATVDGIALRIGPHLEAFSAWFQSKAGPIIENFSTNALAAFDRLASGIGRVKDVFSGVELPTGAFAALGPVIGLAAGAFAPLLTGLPVVGGLFAGITGPMGLVVGAITAMVASSPALQGALGGAFQQILQALSDLFVQIGPSIGQVAALLGSTLTMAADALAPVITSVVGAIVPLIPIIGELIVSLVPPLIAIFQAVIPVVLQIITAIAPLVAMLATLLIPIIQALMPVVTTVFNIIAAVITAVMGIIQGVIQVVTGIISGDWGQVWEGIKNVFGGIWDTIVSVVNGAISLVGSVISDGLNAVFGFIGSVLGGIGTFFADTWNNVINGVSGFIGNLVQFFADIPGNIMGALGNIGDLLINAGKDILDGFLRGLENGFNAVKNFVGGIGEWIAKNKGPKAYDLALLVPAGGWIMDGLENGIEASLPSLRSTLSGVSSTIQAGVSIPPAPSFTGGGVSDQGAGSRVYGGSGVVVNNYNPVAESTSKTVEKISSTLSLAGAF